MLINQESLLFTSRSIIVLRSVFTVKRNRAQLFLGIFLPLSSKFTGLVVHDPIIAFLICEASYYAHKKQDISPIDGLQKAVC